MSEPRRHPKHLAAKFRHYASRISHIPSGGRMPRDLITDARRLIIERMAQMTDTPTAALMGDPAAIHELAEQVQCPQCMDARTHCQCQGRTYLITDETAPLPSQAEMVAAMRERFDCTPRQLIEPSPGGEPLCHSTNEKPCTKSVRLHQDGAEDPGHE